MLPDLQCSEPRFIVDRMLGTLTRYLRFMGYDTISANSFSLGNSREDTLLLSIAHDDHRILLTRDHELACRGGDAAILVTDGDAHAQVRQLIDRGIISPRVAMSRCSLCNTQLRPATADEIRSAAYAPARHDGFRFMWCDSCGRLYWNGSHAEHLAKALGVEKECQDS